MLPTSRTILPALLTTALAVPALGALAPPADAAARPTCHGLRATQVGTAGKDRIVGTPRRDVIVGLGGDDRIDGRGGNDVICGGDGADTLVGGAGDDRIETGRHARETTRDGLVAVPDQVEGGPGDDTLVLQADTRPVTQDGGHSYSILTYRHSAKGVRVSLGDGRRGTARGDGRDTITLQEPVRLIGSPHDDRLTGSPGADDIYGGTGDDVVSGLGGDDSLTGDPYQVVRDLPTERDQVSGGDGDDEVYVRTGADVVHGDVGNDSLVAYSAQPAQLLGDDGDDVLTTQPVTGFALDGGAGTDTGAFVGADDPASDPAGTWVVHSSDGRVEHGAVTGTATTIETFTAPAGQTVQRVTP